MIIFAYLLSIKYTTRNKDFVFLWSVTTPGGPTSTPCDVRLLSSDPVVRGRLVDKKGGPFCLVLGSTHGPSVFEGTFGPLLVWDFNPIDPTLKLL